MTQILKVFGVIFGSDEIGFPLSDGEGGGAVNVEEVAAPYIEAIAAFRHKLKNAAKDKTTTMKDILEICDWVRDEVCVELGVKLEDHASKNETTWKMVNPEDLKREIEENKAAERAKVLAKRQGKIDKKLEEIEKVKLLAIPPTEFFKVTQGDKFKEFGPDGMPTLDLEGEKVGKGPLKKMKKVLDKHAKGHEAQMKKYVLLSPRRGRKLFSVLFALFLRIEFFRGCYIFIISCLAAIYNLSSLLQIVGRGH